MTCENCIHCFVCYRRDSVSKDFAKKCECFVDDKNTVDIGVIEKIKANIEDKRKFYSQEIDNGDGNIAFGLELALDIIEESLNLDDEK